SFEPLGVGGELIITRVGRAMPKNSGSQVLQRPRHSAIKTQKHLPRQPKGPISSKLSSPSHCETRLRLSVRRLLQGSTPGDDSASERARDRRGLTHSQICRSDV